MTDLKKLLNVATQWNCYTNVLTMLRRRGYFVPSELEKSFKEYSEAYNQCLDDHLVLQKLSFIVSKDINQKSIKTFDTKDKTKCSYDIPDINDCISSILEVSEHLKQLSQQIETKTNCTLAKIDDQEEFLESKLLNIAVQECATTADRVVLNMGDFAIPRCEPQEVLVLFCRKWDRALGIEPVMQLLKYQQLLGNRHMILILHNAADPKYVLTPAPKKLLQMRRYPEQTSNGAIVEWFSAIKCATNITASIYNSKFKKYTKERAEKWLQEHGLKPHQMECIRLDDPIAQYYDYRFGDFIEIQEVNNTKSFRVIGTDK